VPDHLDPITVGEMDIIREALVLGKGIANQPILDGKAMHGAQLS